MKHRHLGVTPFVLLTCAACVPSQPIPPAGAAGFETQPSPASRGEPFVTSDGWTVSFTSFVVQTSLEATPADDATSHGAWERHIWDLRAPTRVFVRALALGPVRLALDYEGRFLRADFDYPSDQFENLGVSDELSARFDVPVSRTSSDYASGPVAILVARGEKDGRVVILDLAMPRYYGGLPEYQKWTAVPGEPVVVRADDLALAPLAVHAERLLAATPTAGSETRFGAYAEADADADGRVTAPELQAVFRPRAPRPNDPEDAEDVYPGTLLDEIGARMRFVFGAFEER